jgi:hypothetical protein
MRGGTVDGGGFQKRTYRPPAHHGWRSKPGYKVFVANRGDVRFDIPSTWVISMPGRECDVELRDRKAPRDDCIIQLSVWHHPAGVDWTGLPLEELAGRRGGAAAPGGGLSFAQQPTTLADDADRDTLWRGEPHYEKRPGAELVWRESAFLDRVERREARARQCVARGPQSHALITMSYWPEHERRFLPVWDELLRTLTLGVYIRAQASAQREGDPREVTERYFGALADVASGGTGRLMLRRPRELRDPDRRVPALPVRR